MPIRTKISQDLSEDDYPGLGRYAWRPEGGGLEWSPGLIRIYGRTEAPRSEAEFMACLHPDDRLRVEGETEAFLTGDADNYIHSFRIVRPDGEVRYVIDRARIERDAQGSVTGIFGMNMDVTELPPMVRAGMDAESAIVGIDVDDMPRVLPDRDRLELGQQTSGLALADIDYRAGTIALGPVAARLYGFGDGPRTVSRDDLHARFHPDDRDRLADEIARLVDPVDGGTLNTEHRIVLPDGTPRWLRVQKRIEFRTVDGQSLPDRGVLAALDITDSKESESRLRQSEERLLLAQQVAGIGVWDIDLETGRHVWSEGLYDLTQIGRETPPSADLFLEHVHPEDEPRLRRAFEGAVRDASSFKEDFRLILPDGTVRHIVGQGRVTSERDGRALRIVGVNYDVTDRKTALLRLRDSEAQLRLILDETAGLAGTLDVDGTLREVNRTVLATGDAPRDAVIGKPFWDLPCWSHDPEEVARLKDAIAQAAGGASLRYDARIKAADGSLRTIDFSLSPVRGADGAVTLLVPSAIDVTDRKAAELRIRESEAKLRMILDETAGLVGILDTDGTLREANRAALEAGGVSREDVIGKLLWTTPWWSHDAEEVARLKDAIARAAGGESFRYDARIKAADGSLRIIDFSLSPLRGADGAVTLLVPSALDVTERKTAELHARESRARLDFALETVGIGAWEVDLATGAVERTRELDRIFGNEEPPEVWHAESATDYVLEEDQQRVRDAYETAIGEGSHLSLQYRIRRADGAIRWVEVAGRPVNGSDGKPGRYAGTIKDITDAKKLETQLAEREAQLALFIQNAPMAIAMFDRDMRYIAHSDRYVTDYHLPDGADLIGSSYYETFPNLTQNCRKLNDSVLSGETVSVEEELFTLPDGTPEWLRWKMAPWYDAGGDIGGVILFSETITERVEARRALRESEARYKILFESIDAGFCVAEVKLDAEDGRIDYRVVEANPAFYARTGFPRDILGAWLREAAPELEEHWFETYGAVARTGEPARFEDRSEFLGRWFDVFAFRIDAPEECRVAILFHDISERKRHEDHVNTLLKEVNHRSKNMLALVNVIAKRTTGTGHADFIAKFSSRIAALAANQDILVHSDWEAVDLERLVRTQLAHFGDLLDTRIHVDGPALTVFPETAERLGMALHELGTNASKYGALSGEAGCVRIAWQVEENADPPQFLLHWSEQGGPEVRAPERKGFGSMISGDLLGSEMGGTVTTDYRRDGLVWSLACPLSSLTMAPDPADVTVGSPAAGKARNGILVVDDDPLLAMSVAEILREAGFEVMGPARSADRALALIAELRPDLAILDVNLGRETSERVAIELQRLGVPFVCVSGYSAKQMPGPLKDAPLLSKPLNDDALLVAVRARVSPAGQPAS